jgi:hypothetical protein
MAGSFMLMAGLMQQLKEFGTMLQVNFWFQFWARWWWATSVQCNISFPFCFIFVMPF